MPHHRTISTGRVLGRLVVDEFIGLSPLREYVHFGDSLKITALTSDHQCHPPTSTEYVHANLLQLADMLLGSVIQSCYRGLRTWIHSLAIGTKGIKKKEVIASPIRIILEKTKRGGGF